MSERERPRSVRISYSCSSGFSQLPGSWYQNCPSSAAALYSGLMTVPLNQTPAQTMPFPSFPLTSAARAVQNRPPIPRANPNPRLPIRANTGLGGVWGTRPVSGGLRHGYRVGRGVNRVDSNNVRHSSYGGGGGHRAEAGCGDWGGVFGKDRAEGLVCELLAEGVAVEPGNGTG